ncbi:hypothetical protein H5410_059152 [Solanum commersonii]|uniref:Uncharacterized protein n=1 Tax=Solanum commersonii TaxID=4109 RepID=A0A9J5W1R1_SOLCO|nr:hypothetical protein H5410_059152 [Solanum commersonii]
MALSSSGLTLSFLLISSPSTTKFGGKKGGALADYKPAFRSSGGRPEFDRGYGGFGCGAPNSSCFS